ncbi:hypothetical protein SAMN04487894_11151 [Niabella drilacis]|uniref:Uncharacterized protein n=1 Tax=Niabella drilacis (strain DSM 25811 / CCM 8410 / CCUG 62505 / LMG 26954 / E90) TaxID=1285928 RepID=A0A1G6W9Q8_NIADE|nr:hypothetical protein SAMN04487894_11151 [Niabella drilacis]
MELCPDSRRFMGDWLALNPGRGSTRMLIIHPAFHARFIKYNPLGVYHGMSPGYWCETREFANLNPDGSLVRQDKRQNPDGVMPR